jgi:hypothetical protein
MPSTIIKLTSNLAVATGVKLKTHPLDFAQFTIRHDWSKTETYPAQANPAPQGTEFVNLATGVLSGEGFRAFLASVPFANKSVTLVPGSNRLIYGSESAPFPVLGIGGSTTDVLITMYVKIADTTGVKNLLHHISTVAGTDLQKSQFLISYGNVKDVLDFYAIGGARGTVAFTPGVWMHLAFYIRCNGYNGKVGQVKIYKNGVAVTTVNTGIPNAFFASDNTIPLYLSRDNTGSFQVGQFNFGIGLDAAGLNPDTLVANDYTYSSQVWTV